jgi:hypothetical protein
MHLKFSHDIEALLKLLAEKPLTLADILAETSERGFSLIMGLLVLPFLFPVPPGLAGPFSAACLLLAVQMAVGRRSPWLPRRIARLRFPNRFALELLKNLRRVNHVLEKIAKPRLQKVAGSTHAWRLNGACIAWLSILLFLPIPFTNPIPTIGILLLVVATLEADGLLMCVGYVLTVLITLAVAFIAYFLISQTPELFQNIFG